MNLNIDNLVSINIKDNANRDRKLFILFISLDILSKE